MYQKEGLMDFTEKNIRNISDYFREGCKERYDKKIGIEIEHFVIKEGGQNASYEEVAGLMKEAFFSEKCYYEGDALISCKTREYFVSLEPAAQLEISMNPRKSIRELEMVYGEFLRRMQPCMERRGVHLETYGYQPYAKAADLPLIPKKRYRYMDAYLKHTDSMGIRMMRGSASVQVSLDYINETDFVQKFQLAQVLSPVLALLCENTPILEGVPNKNHLARTVIWNHVDSKRCGIVPGSMEEDFSFHAYAWYVYHVPLIFVEEDGEAVSTGNQSAADYYRERLMSREEIEHMLSMVFPDVRLKNYIEVRMADSLPRERVFAYGQLMKDIFYGTGIRDIQKFLGRPLESEIVQAKENLIQYGENGVVYGKTIPEIYAYLKEISPEPMRILDQEEKKAVK